MQSMSSIVLTHIKAIEVYAEQDMDYKKWTR